MQHREPSPDRFFAEAQVWADVGGTFTDCFVKSSGGIQVTKVLSSGLVRASLIERVDSRTLKLRLADQNACDDFWVGAKVSRLDSGGRPVLLGTVDRSFATEGIIRIAGGEIPEHIDAENGDEGEPDETVIEIDAGIEAPVLASRLLLQTPLRVPLPRLDVRLGTTRGTNALLTRGGAATGLLVTRGFADVLRIGEQNRPHLFSLAIEKNRPLTEQVAEVDERLDAHGNVLFPIDPVQLHEELSRLFRKGARSLAVCLLHAHVNDCHERVVDRVAREVGFEDISLSSEVAPLVKLVSRAETTALDAYLNPILDRYVATTWKQFGGPERCRLRLMTSGGNLVAPAAFRGRDSILSGPAGGVVALSEVARQHGTGKAIGLDMGGTSTDVSRFDGRIGRRYESEVAGVRIMTPMMDIHTVAAGGGSICGYRHGRFFVGPDSAGANPGPACYGRGGPLTITDVNLILGRIPVERFPLPLDRVAADARLRSIAEEANSVAASTNPSSSRDDSGEVDESNAFDSAEMLAEGFLQIAVTHMAEAARTVSTAEGADPRTMTLVGFGGAAGQHLCRVAEALQIRRVLDHPHAAMLSALGMGLARVGRVVTRGVYERLHQIDSTSLQEIVESLRDEVTSQLAEEQSASENHVDHHFECDLRFWGTESTLTVSLEPAATLRERFHQKHQTTFGYDQPDRQVELVCVRCEATIPADSAVDTRVNRLGDQRHHHTQLWCEGRWQKVPLLDRDGLTAGQALAGPCMVVSDHSTLVVEPSWQGEVGSDGTIELTPCSSAADATVDRVDDPILLEVVSRRLQGIADSMGEVLRRTSVSVNVKERRDYSCAVFRGDGSLIANAPHVPVHLGAMGHTVRRLMTAFPTMFPGDCYLSNDPFNGGSHLPDVTVVTPVFCDGSKSETGHRVSGPAETGRPDFFVASRAHHAEIGGRTPGSMPPDATCLAEEGILIRDFALVRNGNSDIPSLRELLQSGPYPSRSVDENIADVSAQQAAGNDGVKALQALAETYSAKTVDALMGRLLDVAGDAVADWITRLPDREMTFRDQLDDRSIIKVSIRRHEKNRLSIDFSGTAGVHPHGFNATPSIVTAAALYVLRCVSGADLPLCDGVLRDVDMIIPEGMLCPPYREDPRDCAAVVAGNVETSQRVVDVLLGALRLAAASQGTMNNLLIGDDSFGYYETIGGGSGATSAHHGASAVHTHMTNTRITDPEVLESRLPLRLHRFAIRADSGGIGRRCGGDGIVRELEFLKKLQVSLITNRRLIRPYGVLGGEPGSAGHNLLVRSGETTELPPSATVEVDAGDRLIIETPGGGGWGRSN